MSAILMSWLGNADLQAMAGALGSDLGPTATACNHARTQTLHMLCDWRSSDDRRSESQARENARRYAEWVTVKTKVERVEAHFFEITDPTDIAAVIDAARSTVAGLPTLEDPAELYFAFSSGTSTMAAAWLLLASTVFDARLLKSSQLTGVTEFRLPFHLALDFSQKRGTIPGVRLTSLDRLLQDADIAMVGHSESMKSTLVRVHRYAPTDLPIFIAGPTGTGKELLANAVHGWSKRSKSKFHAINCAAIPSELAESELFGHVKGAFTGAVTDHDGALTAVGDGTLFLDEVTELPRPIQAKLLRVLQDGEYRRVGDTKSLRFRGRIVAATNQNPYELMNSGHLRPDLFYRLARLEVTTTALRERREDIDALIDHYLPKICRGLEVDSRSLAPPARKLLLKHEWPGNVRELQRVLERAVIESDNTELGPDDIRPHLERPEMQTVGILDQAMGGDFKLDDVLDDVSAHYLRRALTEGQGSVSGAARLLGFQSHQRVANWCAKHGIDPAEFRPRA